LPWSKIATAAPFAQILLTKRTYLKARGDHWARTRVMLVVIGLDRFGRKEALGLALDDAETRASWSD